ncbi:MAG: hypothetical protein COB01_09675 [Lutibacter sp.]|nr:MAG: hypothetical protein COB01_09675 [Lutibacter sp.]
MQKYFVNDNAQSNGDHEVHNEDCSWLPKPENRTDLEKHSNCKSAVLKAKNHYSQVNGCYFCSSECHTS